MLVIEHHQAVMANTDWTIDRGPGAGHAGRRVVFEGTPAALVAGQNTLTGRHLAGLWGAGAVSHFPAALYSTDEVSMSIFSRGWLLLSAPLFAASLWSGDARADAAGDKALAAMDAAMNRAKSQTFEYEAINQEPGKAEKKLGLVVSMKGEKSLMEFVAPADVKGTKVLILSMTQMYIYLPAFGKVRRIASHMSDQGFMGLAFNQDDFATQRYGSVYVAQLNSESGSESKVTLTPKAGQQASYAKIEVTIETARQVPTELKYFNADGKHVKTETRVNYSCQGDICTPGERKMVDHTKGGLWTRMIRKTWKTNPDLSDDLFSKRNLEK